MARDVTVHFTDEEEALVVAEAQAAGVTAPAEILTFVENVMKDAVRVEVLDRYMRREQAASQGAFDADWPE